MRDSVHDNLTQTLIFLQGERIAGLAQVSEERIAALRALTEERIAALLELREIAANERLALSRDIEKSTLKLVDHAAWRMTQLVAGACGFLVVAAILLLLLIRRLFFSPHEPQYWLHRESQERKSENASGLKP